MFKLDYVKKAVLISYYYPPCNYVPSSRVKSFVESLNNRAYAVTVFTRHWSGEESVWADFVSDSVRKDTLLIKEKCNEIYSLPFKALKSPRAKILSKINTFWKQATGDVQAEIGLQQHFDFIKEYCKKHKDEIRFILMSSPPYNLIQLGYQLSRELNIPFVADFRDYQNRRLLDGIKGSLKDRIEFALENHWVKKWIKKAILVSVVNKELFYHFSKFNRNVIEVKNGYSNAQFDKTRLVTQKNNDHFYISLIGTVYTQQDYTKLFQAIKKFLLHYDDPNIFVELIGLKGVPEVADDIASMLKEDSRVKITGRLAFDVATQALLKSDLLVYPGWKGSKGRYSTKIFEYLGSGAKILICPGDGDVIDQLVQGSKSGCIANTSEEAFSYIQLTYQAKKLGVDNLPATQNHQSLFQYSREYQNDLLIDKIESLTSEASN